MSDPSEPHAAGPGRPLDPEHLLRAAASEPRPASAAGWEPPTLAELAPHFPELVFEELVGRGGMGAVYRARQARLGRTIALKVLPPELARDPEFEERFLREARALAALQHPRILTVHDFGERGGLYYLVTEFVEGMNLRQLMQMGELSPTEALRITPQICEALQYAHDHGVVHRDIKPENVLIDRHGNTKIADFGLARIVGEPRGQSLTRSSQLLGTPHYMAPEQWRHGVPIDHRADIYAVGVMLYEMLTGQLPLGAFEPPSKLRDLPEGLDAVVRRTLAQQPEQRYQRASEVGDDVRREGQAADATGAQRGDSQHAERQGTREVAPERARGSDRAPRVLIFAWAFALSVLLALAAQLLGRGGEEQRSSHASALEVGRAMDWAGTEGHELSSDDRVLRLYHERVLIPAWMVRRAAAAERGEPFDEPFPAWSRAEPRLAPSPWFLSLRVALPVGVLVLGGLLTASGFRAIAVIRERRAGTRGLALAVFTAWFVPLALLIAIPVVVLDVHVRDDDLATVVSTIIALVLAVCGVVWMVSRHRVIRTELDALGPR
jgi:tRNA A-37 threonylcarbamoyl transferase component Bud32